MNERSYHLKGKPVTFKIQQNYKGKEGQNIALMIKQDGREEVNEHEFYELPEEENIVRPPNIRDVGNLLSNNMSCTMKG
jgi:hypothetical protein